MFVITFEADMAVSWLSRWLAGTKWPKDFDDGHFRWQSNFSIRTGLCWKSCWSRSRKLVACLGVNLLVRRLSSVQDL